MAIIQSRDTKSEFETPVGQVVTVNLTTDLRPDALSPDYKTAYTYGPSVIGDVSAGLLSSIWKAELVSGTITSVQLSKGTGGGYSTPTQVFSYSTAATGSIRELDVAFTSDGRTVVSTEMVFNATSSIYLYWYNAVVSNFAYDKFASSARTPRVVLDNPSGVGDSDVLLFYVSESTPNSLFYRQQRDNYATTYSIPLPTTASAHEVTYLEDVAKLTDSRLAIFYSRHNTSSSRWTLERMESVLYPVYVREDSLYTAIEFVTGSLRTTIVNIYATGSNTMDLWTFDSGSVALVSQSWYQTLFNYAYTGSNTREIMYFDSGSTSLVSQSWYQTLFNVSASGDEMYSASVAFVTSSLIDILFEYTQGRDMYYSASVSLVTCSLITV